MKALFKIFLIFFVIILCLSLIFIIWIKDIVPNTLHEIRYWPKNKPNPNVFITYHGFIDPNLTPHLVNLKISTVYQTTKAQCEQNYNPLVGDGEPMERVHILHVKPDSQGNYQYRVALDRYLPGSCHWQAVLVEVSYKDYKYPSNYWSEILFSSDPRKSTVIKKQNDNFVCSSSKCSSYSSNVYSGDKYISNQHSQTLEINFYRDKK